MESLVEQMCQSIGNEAPDLRRSFWIHGSYGTGKSYAAIFVKHLMEEKPEVVGDFLAASNRLAKYKNRVMKFRSKGDFLVVWQTGCNGIPLRRHDAAGDGTSNTAGAGCKIR